MDSRDYQYFKKLFPQTVDHIDELIEMCRTMTADDLDDDQKAKLVSELIMDEGGDLDASGTAELIETMSLFVNEPSGLITTVYRDQLVRTIFNNYYKLLEEMFKECAINLQIEKSCKIRIFNEHLAADMRERINDMNDSIRNWR